MNDRRRPLERVLFIVLLIAAAALAIQLPAYMSITIVSVWWSSWMLLEEQEEWRTGAVSIISVSNASQFMPGMRISIDGVDVGTLIYRIDSNICIQADGYWTRKRLANSTVRRALREASQLQSWSAREYPV